MVSWGKRGWPPPGPDRMECRRLARKLARVAVGSGPAVEPLVREAPVMDEGSWVGLDVHARSVVAGVIDRGTGEVRSLRPAGVWRDGRVVEDAAGPGSGGVRGGGRLGTGLRARVPRRG